MLKTALSVSLAVLWNALAIVLIVLSKKIKIISKSLCLQRTNHQQKLIGLPNPS
jgi:hypothetical protein|tara:strand:+ start:615 stop:776 length:162 start_codon:yes stop_codon:yes gene_type:complete